MGEPREWTQDDIDAEMILDDDCPKCGGTGVVYDCFDGFCVDAEYGCDDCGQRCGWCSAVGAQRS